MRRITELLYLPCLVGHRLPPATLDTVPTAKAKGPHKSHTVTKTTPEAGGRMRENDLSSPAKRWRRSTTQELHLLTSSFRRRTPRHTYEHINDGTGKKKSRQRNFLDRLMSNETESHKTEGGNTAAIHATSTRLACKKGLQGPKASRINRRE